ncbi:hypothetical protein AMJ52_06835 [candidate division TA06 bacterium DG_78]|uniref:Uncharacterized protein n=1 Tax=candidate division TA06 bacterium DG_78 TaxID=1703772 RepID=A0A0S7YDX6_UNCT6|nr:MAG: hypothetical protein AMJ52_06835 [candidate division TA06 bacterium DG_78]
MKSLVKTFLLLFILFNVQTYAEVVASKTVDFLQKGAPVITRQGEFLLDTTIVSVSGIGEQCHPAVAFNGTNYLLVWTEYRHGEPIIYGARMNPQGVVLDTEGIAIKSMSEFQQLPSVVSDGSDYFVVWKEWHRDVLPWWYKPCLYGSRVSQSGMLIDTSAIEIAEYVDFNSQPLVAFDGTNHLVVWRNERATAGIYGVRVSPSGVVLDTLPFFISTGSSPALSFDGTNYLVVWEKPITLPENYDIFCTRVTPAGVILDTSGIAVCTDPCRQTYPTVSFDGMNYLIVWEDERNGPFSDIYGARVSPSGLVLDTVGIPVSIDYNCQRYPSVVFEGANHLVVWQEYDFHSDFTIRGARVSTSGIVIDTPSITISVADSIRCLTAACSDGSNYLVAWQDRRSTAALKYDIFAARIDQSGQVLDAAGIPLRVKMPSQQSFPAAAFDGTNYFVVWQDYRSSSFPVLFSSIYGIRVNQSGGIIDSSAIAISDAPHTQGGPAVAFDGTNYFVVWDDIGEEVIVYGARVSQAGIVIDTQGIMIPGIPDLGACSPAIAFDGTNYLVVFTDKRGLYTYGTLVSPTGTVFDPFQISQSIFVANPAVAFGDTNYLVVSDRGDIYAARVTPSGIVLDEFVVSAAPEVQCYPSVAFDGTNFLVVWSDSRKGFDSLDIYGARVSSGGVVLDTAGIRICGVENYQASPSVAFDGSNYIVVWEDYRSDSTSHIYGAEVSPAGLLIDTFTAVIQQGDQIEPQLTHGNTDQILLVYSGWTNSINAYPAYTQRIWGKFSPSVGIEEHDDKQVLNYLRLQIHPNPFRHRTDIKYQIPVDCDAEIGIYDVSGRLVQFFDLKSNISNLQSKIMWSGKDENDRILPNGIYFCRLKTRKGSIMEKIVFLR